MDCTFHGAAKRQTRLSDFQGALVVNNPLASARDARTGFDPGSSGFSAEGNSSPLYYSPL